MWHSRSVIITVFSTLILVAGCTSPEERAARAEAEIKEERLKTLAEYKDCVREADGNTNKLVTCDALLKAIEALK